MAWVPFLSLQLGRPQGVPLHYTTASLREQIRLHGSCERLYYNDLESFMKEKFHMFRRILASSRYLILIAVVATFLAALAVIVYGALTVFHLIYEMFVSSTFTPDEAKHFAVAFIEMIDLFLLGTVLYIVALGLYDLFIDDTLAMPPWLMISDLDDLKGKLLGVVIVLLAVTFLGNVVTWSGNNSILSLGLAVGLVLLALGYILGRSIKSRQPEQPVLNNRREDK
jgi:uncharacterized membrane protein YqhA